MYYPSVHILLLLWTFSVTLAFNPRAVSLQRRHPKPGIVRELLCCTRFPQDSELAAVPEASALPHESYPTRLVNPSFAAHTGERVFVGVVALGKDDQEVLLIRARDGSEGWRLPESDWNALEEMPPAAVKREAFDTAGVSTLDEPLSVGEVQTTIGKNKYMSLFYRLVVSEEHETWKNDARWTRKWASYDEAKELLERNNHAAQAVMVKRAMFGKEKEPAAAAESG